MLQDLADEYAEESRRTAAPKVTEVDEIVTVEDIEKTEAIEMLEKLRLTLSPGNPLLRVTRDEVRNSAALRQEILQGAKHLL